MKSFKNKFTSEFKVESLKENEMEKIVLVGNQGLVGSHFIEKFSLKYKIESFNRSNSNNLQLPDVSKSLVFLAQSTDYKSTIFTADLLDVNISLLRNFLTAGIGKTNKIIFFSTGSVYQINTKVIDEDTPLNYNSTNPYVCCKIMAELLLHSFLPFYKSIIIVRPFFIYGKNQKQNMLFSSMITNIRNGNPITLNDGKGMIFNPVHAQDAAGFIHHIIEQEYKGLSTFNLFGPEVTNLGSIVNYIEQELNLKANLNINKNQPSTIVATTKFKELFQSKISVLEGLKKMIHNN